MITTGSELAAESLRRNDWLKSSVSSCNGTCVEVRFHDGLVSIRDSKYRRDPAHDPHREPIITVPAEQWTAFLDDLTGHTTQRAGWSLIVERGTDKTLLRATGQGTDLSFTPAEWQSFLVGVHSHEFDHPGYQDRFHDHEVTGEPEARRQRDAELSIDRLRR